MRVANAAIGAGARVFAARAALGSTVLRAAPSFAYGSVRSFSLFRDQNAVVHRSNAQELVSQVPVIMVDGSLAICDGGGGAAGHPAEYIKLDRRQGNVPEICKYCGLRYQMKDHHHDIAWDLSPKADLPAGRSASVPAPSVSAPDSALGDTASHAASTTTPTPSPAAAAEPPSVRSPTADDVSVFLDLLADTVTIRNKSTDSLSLKGYVLTSERGDQVFKFPDEAFIPPGGSTTVWSGKGAKEKHNPPADLFWTNRHMWNDKGDTAVLAGPSGEELHRVVEKGAKKPKQKKQRKK